VRAANLTDAEWTALRGSLEARRDIVRMGIKRGARCASEAVYEGQILAAVAENDTAEGVSRARSSRLFVFVPTSRAYEELWFAIGSVGAALQLVRGQWRTRHWTESSGVKFVSPASGRTWASADSPSGQAYRLTSCAT
jgi:hypothetical protein